MNNPMAMLIQGMMSGANPMQFLQSMARNNPQANMLMNMVNGKNPQQLQQIAENMAKEKGTTAQQVAQRGIGGDPLDFCLAMNMMYSDYGNVAKELGVSNIDFYVKMAQAFLDDEDSVHDKLAAYYDSIVRH